MTRNPYKLETITYREGNFARGYRLRQSFIEVPDHAVIDPVVRHYIIATFGESDPRQSDIEAFREDVLEDWQRWDEAEQLFEPALVLLVEDLELLEDRRDEVRLFLLTTPAARTRAEDAYKAHLVQEQRRIEAIPR